MTCRLRRRVLLSGFYPQKGEILLPSAVGLGPFWVLVNLFTGVVAPTTCNLLLVALLHDSTAARVGVILLNPHLIGAPRDCVDYVIYHELCHLQEHNHSSRYYRLL